MSGKWLRHFSRTFRSLFSCGGLSAGSKEKAHLCGFDVELSWLVRLSHSHFAPPANARFMVFVSCFGFQGVHSSYPHCTAESPRLNLQPSSRWSKRQPTSVILIRAKLNCFQRIHSALSGSSWAPCAGESGRPSIVDLGLEMPSSESTGDKDGVEQKEPQNKGSPVSLGVVENADTSAGGEMKEQLLNETLSLREDSNGGSSQGLPQWAIRRTEGSLPPKLLTLVIIQKDGKVLLGMKKRGFGKGYYNGFGGKVEKGETIEEAATRELQEEAGVTPVDMSKRALLTFHFDNDPIAWEVHVYHVSEIVGNPCETEEMEPRWFTESEIPYETMWSDDILWYPEFLKGRHFTGNFYFENTTTLVGHSLQVIST